MDALPLSPRVVLLGAARLIRERGWCQFRLVDRSGRVCMLGAIDRFSHESFPEDRAKADSVNGAATMHLFMNFGEGCPVAWNDARGRTATDVIELLERIAGIAA